MKRWLHFVLLVNAFLIFHTLHAQPGPCTATTDPSQTICLGGCVTFSAYGGGGFTSYNYQWSTGATTQSINVCPDTTTTYTVTVTASGGCTATANQIVIVSTLTPFDITASPSSVGTNNTLLTATSSSTSFFDCIWSTGNSTFFVNVSPLSTTTYCVTCTNSSGCTASACETVQPMFTINATCGECNGSLNLPNAGTYWLSGPGIADQIVIGPGTINGLCPGNTYVLLNPNSTYNNIVVQNINLPFTADAGFTTSIGNADVLYACTGQPIQFTSPDGNLSVQWDFGEPVSMFNTSNLPNTTYTYQNTGTYIVTLYAQGCTNADTLQRTVVVEQGIAPDIECASLVCPGDEQIYTTPVVCDTYNWTVIGGSITAGQNTSQITVVWNNVAMGTVELTVGDCDGSVICNPIGSIQVPIVSGNLPISGLDVVCHNTLAVYSVPQYGGVQYTWSVTPPASGTVVWQQFNQVGVQWNTADGTIQVNANSSLAGCSSVSSMPVQVNPIYSLSGSDLVCPGSQVVYSASSGLHNWQVSGNAAIVGNSTNTNSITVEAGLGLGGFTISAMPNNLNFYCNYPQTLSVNVGEQPASPLVLDLGYVCPGNGYIYEIASPASGVSYFWNITGGTPASGSGPVLGITWLVGSPTYQIAVTAQSNTAPYCSATGSVLTVLPLSQLLISGNDNLCAGDKDLYLAAPFLLDLTYTWAIDPPLAGSIINGQGTFQAEVQWNAGYPLATLSVSACNISAQFPVVVNQLPDPVITPSGNLCDGSSISLSVSPSGFTQYQWQNGSSASSIPISSGGSYLVTVTDVNGCTGNTATNIEQLDLPTAKIFAENDETICLPTPHNVILSALQNEGYTYQWLLNGTPIANTTPNHLHVATGVVNNFTYRILITDANGCSLISNAITVYQINCSGGGGDPPTPGCLLAAGSWVDFNIVPPVCHTVTVENLSTGANYYVWDFNEIGTPITVPDTAPQTYTYSQAGFYNIELTGNFTNLTPPPATCNWLVRKKVNIPIEADFSYSNPCLGFATQFTNQSVTTNGFAITYYNWDFGDGNTANIANPLHTYSASGSYTVTLTVGNAACSHSMTKTVVINTLPNAAFTSPPEVCEGIAATLTPNSIPTNIRWDWDFGDGATITTQTPQKTYNTAGNYTIQLTVTDNKGCTNTFSQTITVLPVNSGVIAPASLTACIGQSISLTAPTGSGFLWSEGSVGNPMLATQTGSYAVTVTQANGCTFKTPPIQLNFFPVPPADISPSATPVNLCPGNSLTLQANAGSNYAYAWSTGQSAAAITIAHNAVPVSGLSVTLTVTDAQTGCSNTSMAVEVNAINLPPPAITPNAYTDLQLCEGESLTLTATHPTLSNFSWNTGTSGNTLTVSGGGNYAVMVTDANGCTNAASVTVGVNEGGNMAAIPVGCYDYCELQPFSVPNIYGGYQWLLNGTPIAGANGNEFTPPQTGDYQLQITTIWGCQDTSDVLSFNLIDCLECLVTADFTYSISCSTIELDASGSSGNGTLSYSWDMGDGNAATDMNVTHNFTAAGNYTVCLTVSNLSADADVCTDTNCFDIQVFNAAQLNIITDDVTNASCGEADGSISLTVEGNIPPYTYEWADGNPNEDLINLSPGVYDLSVTDAVGCTTTASFTIAELPLAESTLICTGSTPSEISVTWFPVGDATGYELSINGGSPVTILPDITGISAYTFTGLEPDTDYTVSLVVLAPSPCINSQPTQVTCTTLPVPCPPNTPDIASQALPTLCGNATGSISLLVSGGTAPYTYLWSNQNPDEDQTNLPAGNYSVTVTDALGCSNTAMATVEAFFDQPVITCTTADDNSITVTWETVVGAAGYQLLLNNDSIITLTSIETVYTFTNLLPDTSYLIGIIALSSLDCGANASEITCSTGLYECITEEIAALLTSDVDMVLLSEPATLTITTTGLQGDLLFEWTANGIPVTCNDSVCVFTPDVPTTYTVTVTDIYGCTATADIAIDVRMPNKVIAPNAFSPNGDAVNSIFRLTGFNVARTAI